MEEGGEGKRRRDGGYGRGRGERGDVEERREGRNKGGRQRGGGRCGRGIRRRDKEARG